MIQNVMKLVGINRKLYRELYKRKEKVVFYMYDYNR